MSTINQDPLPRLFEGSALQSQTEASRRVPWQEINRSARGQRSLSGAASFADQRLRRFRRPAFISGDIAPFSIVPTGFSTSNGPSSAMVGYTFRVHGGYVLGADFANGMDASTKDTLVDAVGSFYAGSDIAMPQSAGQPVTLYIWLEWTSSAARILWGPDPTADFYIDQWSPAGSTTAHAWDHASSPWNSVSDWAAAPSPDSNHAMIGMVDATVGGFAASIAGGGVQVAPCPPIIRQYINSDFDPISGGGGTVSFFKFANSFATTSGGGWPIVCVSGYPFNGTTTGSSGVWIACDPALSPIGIESYTTGSLSGSNVNYTYTWGYQKRTCSWTGGTEYDFITPEFNSAYLIQARPASSPILYVDGGPVLWQEISPRCWAWDPYYTGT